MTRLQNGDIFPTLALDTVGGGKISLPGDLAGEFGVVLITRGSWCPYCNAQLAAFSRARETLDELGIKVVACSVDDEGAAAELVEKHGLAFPVGHSVDADQIAAATGAYVNEQPHHLQATGFVLAPDGTVLVAVYSSGAIGRLLPDDVAGFVGYVQSQQAATPAS